MAEFCTKCFTALNENGQCPACGYCVPAPVAASSTQVLTEEPRPAYAAPTPQPVYEAPVPAESTPRFCIQCGGTLDENGQCPVCDAPTPAPAPVAAFCIQCGGTLDENGQCPVCDTPTPEPAPAPTPVPALITEPAQTKKTSALSVIATVLLSLCLFVTMLLSVSIATIRNTISKGGFNKLAEEVDVALLLRETDIANSNTIDEFYYRLERDYGIRLDDDKLAELVEDSTLPDYISDKVGDFTDDFFEGEAELVITKEEMIDLVRENEHLLEREMADGAYRELTYDDYEIIAGWLFNEDELVLISTDKLQDEAPALYQAANIGLSYVALIFFLLLSAFIGFVMCRNSLSQAAVGGGVVFLLLGGLTAVAAAVVAWIPGLWNSIVGNNWALSIAGAVLTANGWIFAILLVLGLAMLITRTVVKHVKKNKA